MSVFHLLRTLEPHHPELTTRVPISNSVKHLGKIVAVCAVAAIVTACATEPRFTGVRQQAATTPAPVLNLGASIQTRLLQAHNRERALVGSAPLRWNPQLQQAAAAYARQLAATGRFQHATAESLMGHGENLWEGTRGTFTPERMVANWSSGSRFFQPGNFPDVSRTGNWMDVAHYTQIIWPQSHSVGCAISSSARFDYLVCRYAPAGNVIGARIP